MKTEEIIKNIMAEKYSIKTESDCGCSIDWDLDERNELACRIDGDTCWIGRIAYIGDTAIAQHIYGESFEWLVEIDESVDGFDEAEEKLQDDIHFSDSDFDEIPEHEENKKEALIDFLNEKKAEGYKLMRDNQQGFANAYACILVHPESIDEIDEDWDELEVENWASEFLYSGDAATEAYNSFKLIKG